MIRHLFLTGLVLCSLSETSQAALTLSALFSDSMVLQRDQPVKVWGWASPDASVTVAIGDQKHTVRAEASGRWMATLEPMSAGGPHTLTVSDGRSTTTVSDVLIGDVWLCSGQSNMAMTVSRSRDAEAEQAAAKFPQIRMFRESSGPAAEPQEKCSGSWSVCSPETVGSFSATAYFFGRRLHQELGVPIGLINSSVGGTSIESWTSLDAQQQVPELEPRLAAWNSDDKNFDEAKATSAYEKNLERWKTSVAEAKEAGKPAPRKPSPPVRPRSDRNFPANLFNGKIAPLVGYTIKGAIWYQGENSAGRGFSHLYGTQLKTLISDWRARWGQGDFPFGWVQLPNFRNAQVQPVEDSGWVLVQEGMLKTLKEPHTGMAVTIDVGEAGDIHPKDKQTVGHRMAQWALSSVYGKDILPMGPIFSKADFRNDGSVQIQFQYAAGLHAVDGKVLGFAVAGKDQKFVAADAVIEGESVVVRSSEVSQPASVRYAWAANPVISLYSSAQIPASPFRTDDWKVSQ
ncbi:MAG: sialate O-acetylesterase [Planctomycetaceae bacterium]